MSQAAQPSVLVVDDKENMLKLFSRILGDSYAVTTAGDGERALALVASREFDVVVSDIQMPGADGFAVLREVKRRWPATEVVLVTAYASIPKAVEAMREGAYDYLAKPFDPDEVALVVARALERRQVLSLRPPRRLHLGRLRANDAGVLVSLAGVAAYCVFLAVRFDDPFAFATVERYWGQGAGPRTWFKVEFFENVGNLGDRPAWLAYVAHPVVTVVALALVPRVFRRFGWGYGVYSLLAVGLAAFGTKDFFGMGRYALAAFPCFAAAGELLADRPRLRNGALAAGGAGLVVMTSFFARGSYLS